MAGTASGYNYLQWALTARQWEIQKIQSRGAEQVRKLTEGCQGAFYTLSRRFDALEDRVEAIDNRSQRIENGVNAILDMLRARPPPVNNQPAPVAGEEEKVGEEKEEAQGKLFHCLLSQLSFSF